MIDLQLITSLIQKNSTLIVGFSGGPDSVFLLTILAQIKQSHNLTIIAAHLDHQWREQSGKDALWCKEFCDNLNIACVIKNPSDLNCDIKNNGSKEELGRKLRRAFFQELAQQYQANHIVLAHHQDDQLETFFMRLIRGSSLVGLCGMREQEGLYLRPLLTLKKEAILQFLNNQNIPFLIDETNTDPKFLRNRIRHQLTPIIIDIDSRFEKNLASCIKNLQGTNDFLDTLTQETMHKISYQNQSHTIHIQMFLQLHEIMQHRILMRMLQLHNICITPSTALFEEIIRFLKSTKHNYHQIHPSYTLIKKFNHFSFKSL